MNQFKQNDKVKNPFSQKERDTLLGWSKLAKEKDVLDGYQRKVVYEAGKYDNIFLTRLSKLHNSLCDLHDSLPEKDQDECYDIRSKGYRLFLETKASCGDPVFQYEVGESYRFGSFWF